jgi:hypothetical protein
VIYFHIFTTPSEFSSRKRTPFYPAVVITRTSNTDNKRNISTEKRHKSGKKRIQKQTSAFGKCPLFFLSRRVQKAEIGNKKKRTTIFVPLFVPLFACPMSDVDIFRTGIVTVNYNYPDWSRP